MDMVLVVDKSYLWNNSIDRLLKHQQQQFKGKVKHHWLVDQLNQFTNLFLLVVASRRLMKLTLQPA